MEIELCRSDRYLHSAVLKFRVALFSTFLVVIAGICVSAQPPIVPQSISGTSSEVRQQAIQKVLEGQRYLIASNRSRSRTVITASVENARRAFERAVELDPTLAEAYTALAEIAITTPPNDIEAGLRLAAAAVKIDKNNFGSLRLLARLNTLKSGLNNRKLDTDQTSIAVGQWKEVARLDPRNAEAWAFLSSLYERLGQSNERINSLRKWQASAPPLESQFYQIVFGRDEDLNPEAASLKLGQALLQTGRTEEAIVVLTTNLADIAANEEAVELLRSALRSATPASSEKAVESVQQAIFGDPTNLALTNLLVDIHERAGRFSRAEQLLLGSLQTMQKSGKTRSLLLLSLGDLYARARRPSDAIRSYEKALEALQIGDLQSPAFEDRELAKQVFGKIVQALTEADKPAEVRTLIEKVRASFGKGDLFADRQLINYFRVSGQRELALNVIRDVRKRVPTDESFRRLEATVLAETGKVDEAVGVMRAAVVSRVQSEKTGDAEIGNGSPEVMIVPTSFDEFSNLLFIAGLYGDAGRGTDAAKAAHEALAIAGSEERKQIAQLALASALQRSGDFATAESTLRALIKQTPGNPIALNNLGYFYVERNTNLDEAVQLIRDALKVDPTNPSFIDSLGWAYFKLRKFEEAEKHLREALRYDPHSATYNEHLGDVLHAAGKPADALVYWQRALDLAVAQDDISRIKLKIGR